MHGWRFKLGVFSSSPVAHPINLMRVLLKLNKNEEIGAVGQITTVTSEYTEKCFK